MSSSLEKDKNNEKEQSEKIDEKLLEKLATEELLREACQGAVRAEAVGPSGWLKNKNAKTNKNFLKNTLKNAISSNNYKNKRKSNNISFNRNKDRGNPYEDNRHTNSKSSHH